MQSQGVLTIEEMCRASGVSRAGFYRDWEQKAPDQAAMALRDAIQRASLEHPLRWRESCRGAAPGWLGRQPDPGAAGSSR